jgi:uncharacterized protein YaaQ
MTAPIPRIIDQLVLATVAGAQAGELVKRVTADGFYVTEIDSQRGILHESTVSLLLGLEGKRLSRLMEHIRECCYTRRQYIPAHVEAAIFEAQPVMIEAEIGGATVFVFDVEHFEQL